MSDEVSEVMTGDFRLTALLAKWSMTSTESSETPAVRLTRTGRAVPEEQIIACQELENIVMNLEPKDWFENHCVIVQGTTIRDN